MGIDCGIHQITPGHLEAILNSVDAFEKFCNSSFSEYLNEDEEVERPSNEGSPYYDEGIYLGKMWNLIHYLITGDADKADYPLGYAIMAGYLLHESSYAWTFVSSDYVKDIAKALAVLSDDDLRKIGKIRPIPEIYGSSSIFEGDIEEALGYFHELKDYYRDAANNGNAILHCLG